MGVFKAGVVPIIKASDPDAAGVVSIEAIGKVDKIGLVPVQFVKISEAGVVPVSIKTGGIIVPAVAIPLNGLQLWLDASAVTGLADADPVGTWADASGLGNDATQATAAKKPTYKVNILNGRPVVRFDGTDDLLALSDDTVLDAPSALTVFVVVKGAAPANVAQQIITKTASIVDTTGWRLYLNPTVNGNVVWRSNWGAVSGASGVNTDFRILTGHHSGADSNQKAFVNGTQVGTGASATNPATNTLKLTIGSGTTGAQLLNGDIAEVIVYNRALSTAERQQVEQYLGNKYGITVA